MPELLLKPQRGHRGYPHAWTPATPPFPFLLIRFKRESGQPQSPRSPLIAFFFMFEASVNLLDPVPSFSGDSASATMLGIDARRGERAFGHRHFATLWLVLVRSFAAAIQHAGIHWNPIERIPMNMDAWSLGRIWLISQTSPNERAFEFGWW